MYPQRHRTLYAALGVFAILGIASLPCASAPLTDRNATSGGDPQNTQSNTIVIIITICALVIILSLGASLAIIFPSLLPSLFSNLCLAISNIKWPPSGIEKYIATKPRIFFSEEQQSIRLQDSPNSTPTPMPSIFSSSSGRVRDISAPLSLIPRYTPNDGPLAESLPRRESLIRSHGNVPMTVDAEITSNQDSGNTTLTTIATINQQPTTETSVNINDEDHHHPGASTREEFERPLPPTPSPSTRPPTYYTDTSRSSMTTLPGYEEPGIEDTPTVTARFIPGRKPSARSNRGRQNRNQYPQPPLSTPPSSCPMKRL